MWKREAQVTLSAGGRTVIGIPLPSCRLSYSIRAVLFGGAYWVQILLVLTHIPSQGVLGHSMSLVSPSHAIFRTISTIGVLKTAMTMTHGRACLIDGSLNGGAMLCPLRTN